MKITKRQLRRIIREEKARILKEANDLRANHDVIANIDGKKKDNPRYTYYGVDLDDDADSIEGNILNPKDLRRLADAIENDVDADPQGDGTPSVIVLDID